MRLPKLKRIYTSLANIGTFGGLNESVVCPDGEFSAMKNMSSRFYPAMGTREARGEGPGDTHTGNGLIYVDGIFEVIDTYCTYKGVRVPDLTVANTQKQLVKMGAMILIFPDKKFYNTADGTQGDLGWIYRSDRMDTPPTITISGDENYTQFKASYDPLNPSSVFAGLYPGDAIAIECNYITQDIEGGTVTDCTGYNGTHIISNMIEDVQYEEVEDVETGETRTVKKVYTYGFEIPVAFREDDPTSWVPTSFPEGYFYRFEREIPSMEYMFECNNRIWGMHYSNTVGSSVNEIYSSKLGNARDWNVFEGTAMDSYALSVGSGDRWTGGINFNGQPLFMKENFILILYGDKPSNFQLVTKPAAGALWPESLVMINQLLYYAARDGVYVFDGTSPRKISEKIKKTLTDAVAGERGGKYYISCLADGDRTLYCYDPKTGIWDREDDTEFKCVTKAQGKLYYIDGDNEIHHAADESEDEEFDWMLESGDIVESSLDMKYISKFRFNLWLTRGSYARIQLKHDDGEWIDCGVVRSSENRTYNLPVIPRRCNKYKWRLIGRGQMKLLGVGREVEGGSELNGNT